jgi:hypothetical protein
VRLTDDIVESEGPKPLGEGCTRRQPLGRRRGEQVFGHDEDPTACANIAVSWI